MSKVFWFDTETTGVDANKNALVQLAYIIEINGQVKAKALIRMRPHESAIIETKALEINNLDPKQLWLAPPVDKGISDLQTILSTYVDRYDKTDKFVQAGYNVGFDDKFLRRAFLRTNEDYYGSWFFWPKIDVASEVAKWLARGNKPTPNFKLETMCQVFDVPIQAHEAMSDIEATRELYYKLAADEFAERKG